MYIYIYIYWQQSAEHCHKTKILPNLNVCPKIKKVNSLILFTWKTKQKDIKFWKKWSNINKDEVLKFSNVDFLYNHHQTKSSRSGLQNTPPASLQRGKTPMPWNQTKQNQTKLSIYIYIYIYIYISSSCADNFVHLSLHPSLSSIVPGRSSNVHSRAVVNKFLLVGKHWHD